MRQLKLATRRYRSKAEVRIIYISALPLKADMEADFAIVGYVPILLQKSLAIPLNDDSFALMRFAVEAVDDGATQSRSGRVFLFISSC